MLTRYNTRRFSNPVVKPSLASVSPRTKTYFKISANRFYSLTEKYFNPFKNLYNAILGKPLSTTPFT